MFVFSLEKAEKTTFNFQFQPGWDTNRLTSSIGLDFNIKYLQGTMFGRYLPININSLCEKVEKILYRNFKNDTKAEIDKFLDNCQKEKVKYEQYTN